MQIFDLCIGREYTDKMNNKKTNWHRVGAMFKRQDEKTGEDRYSLLFDSYPSHGENVLAFPKVKKEGPASNEGTQPEPVEALPTISIDEPVENVKLDEVPFE